MLFTLCDLSINPQNHSLIKVELNNCLIRNTMNLSNDILNGRDFPL